MSYLNFAQSVLSTRNKPAVATVYDMGTFTCLHTTHKHNWFLCVWVCEGLEVCFAISTDDSYLLLQVQTCSSEEKGICAGQHRSYPGCMGAQHLCIIFCFCMNAKQTWLLRVLCPRCSYLCPIIIGARSLATAFSLNMLHSFISKRTGKNYQRGRVVCVLLLLLCFWYVWENVFALLRHVFHYGFDKSLNDKLQMQMVCLSFPLQNKPQKYMNELQHFWIVARVLHSWWP